MSKITFAKVISLGCFCSPALWIKELGLRNCSYPLDWILTPDLRRTNDLIENNFTDFLEIKYLIPGKRKSQFINYQNTKYKIGFIHDFSSDIALEGQLIDVQTKYARRIERFYEAIYSGSILFIRYVTRFDMDEAAEIDRFIDIIKRSNDNFKLILVKNSESTLGTIKNKDFILKIFEVEKDPGDIFRRALPDELSVYLNQHIDFVFTD